VEKKDRDRREGEVREKGRVLRKAEGEQADSKFENLPLDNGGQI
jgi:hypothetical protein